MPTHMERERRKARKSALSALYCGDVTAGDASECLAQQEPLAPATAEFAARLVAGVSEHQAELDRKIADVAEHWSIDRMPPIDRAILRLALYEIEYLPDVPEGASINEAVDLARCYSTTDSSRFVNGLLGRLAERAAARAAT